MKIWLAGETVFAADSDCKIALLFKKCLRLHSYYFVKLDLLGKGWWEVDVKNKVRVFLDSGAFSAKSIGVDIDIDEYIAFIKQYEDFLEVYANLDVIHNPKATLRNQRYMESKGLHPVPVFHMGEPVKYLRHYLYSGYDYIALGGMVSSAGRQSDWLDYIFTEFLTDEKGMPKVKVHGFGMTSLRLMLRYPWYSVDSTSWVMTGRMGSIYVPRFRRGTWQYGEDSWKIAVSSRSPGKKEAGKHFTTLPDMDKRIVLDYIHYKGFKMGRSRFIEVSQDHELKENERWAGKKPKDKFKKRLLEVIEEEGLCNTYVLRDQINIMYFLDLQNSMPKWPWPFKKKRMGLGL